MIDDAGALRVVFIGASAFGFRCLETCLALPDVHVAGVVTAPKTFTISYRPEGVTNVLHADIASFAKARSIPLRTLRRSMHEPGLLDEVMTWTPDAFLVAGWYHMIPASWRERAPAYGLHASLLPDYSGGAPLVWAMIHGESQTGITLFQMDHGVDAGPIAGQKEEPIFPDDTIASLYARIEQRGMELIREVLPSLARGTLSLRPQDESRRRLVPQRSPDDGRIDWGNEAAYIDRFIRAQTHPYPGAFTTLGDKPLHIWRAKPVVDMCRGVSPGVVCCGEEGQYYVACGAHALELKEISFQQGVYEGPQLACILARGGQHLGGRAP